MSTKQQSIRAVQSKPTATRWISLPPPHNTVRIKCEAPCWNDDTYFFYDVSGTPEALLAAGVIEPSMIERGTHNPHGRKDSRGCGYRIRRSRKSGRWVVMRRPEMEHARFLPGVDYDVIGGQHRTRAMCGAQQNDRVSKPLLRLVVDNTRKEVSSFCSK